MITVSAAVAAVLTRSRVYRISVQSVLGAEVLADDIPVDNATETIDIASAVPESVTLTVPRTSRGQSWVPTSPDHPLYAAGQRLIVRVGIGRGDATEWLQRGVYLITSSEPDGDHVTVQADGLLALLSEARLISPYSPSGTMSSALRGLTEPALTCLISDDLDDRTVPSGINIDSDRLGGVGQVLDAWAAAGTVDPQGFLNVAPAEDPTEPLLSLTDGTGGVLIRASGTSSRKDVYNAVVAVGTADDGGVVQAVSYLTTGPFAYGGPFNPLPVPYRFESPLLTTEEQCQAAADTIVTRLARTNGRQYRIELPPDPRLQGYDPLAISSEELDLNSQLCTLRSLSLPLLATSGMSPMTATVVTVDA